MLIYIVNMISILIGAFAFICFLIEELTHKSILYWINHYFYKLRFAIKKYIIDPLLHPKYVTWCIKHRLNYFHMSRKDLYELDDDTWNEFLMLFVKPDKRKEAGYNRDFHLAIKSGLNSEKAYYKCKVIQPIKDLLLKGDKKR